MQRIRSKQQKYRDGHQTNEDSSQSQTVGKTQSFFVNVTAETVNVEAVKTTGNQVFKPEPAVINWKCK